jgi:dihydropteroate synthase
MGVLNVTPDSFSDGGRWADLDAAVAHGLAMTAAGADLVDVGGESTRPGAERVDPTEEIRRVVPAVRALAAAGVRVSVDTSRAAVAEAALEAGASIVNDVSGGLADPAMAKVVAAAGVPWVLMHWRGHSRDMQELATYGDVVGDVRRELSRQVDAAVAPGWARTGSCSTPGLGFAKTAEHNWTLLARLDELVALGFPVLVGASRKGVPGPAARRSGRDARPGGGAGERDRGGRGAGRRDGGVGVRVHEGDAHGGRDAGGRRLVAGGGAGRRRRGPGVPPVPRPRGWQGG